MAQRRKAKKVRPEAKARPARPSTPEPAEPGADAVREATRLHVAGKLAEALPFYEQAVIHHRSPALLNNYGAALRDLKRSAEAVPLFREAAEQDKVYADARLNLGLSLMDTGAFEEADAALKRAAEMLPPFAPGKPADPRSLQALGGRASIARSRQQFDALIELHRKAVEQAPANALLHSQLGGVYYDLGKIPEAVQAFETAVRLDPDMVVAQGNLGTTYLTAGRTDDSIACQRRAIALEPDNEKHYVNLGAALKAKGALTEAAAAYRKAVAMKPDYDYAINNLGNMLREQGSLEEAVERFREAIAHSPEYVTAFSNLLFTLNSLPDISAAEIYAEHRRFGEYVEKKAPPATAHANRADPEKRIRIGYLSPDFLGHSVAYFIENLLEHHDRGQVEVVCYALNKRSDSMSRRLQARVDLWRPCSFLDNDQLASLIREDGIDILVDLAGHTADNRLLMMAQKPAPIQVSYCGYPNTTGLSRIDYRMSDALVDPPGESDRLHSEKLVRLPRSFLCFRPSDFAGAVPPRPVATTGHVTFGSFNALSKMTDPVVATWAEILNAVPGSKLLQKNNAFTDPAIVELYRRRFAASGLDPDRLEMVGRQPMIGDHLAMYGRVDIALDPFPYNGTTTTCEALWMGVPLVALRGDRHVGRVSAALLHHVGCDDLVADDIKGYVATAVALAKDPARIQSISAGLRPAMAASPIMDAPGFAREVEAAYRQMWRDYCRERGAMPVGDAPPSPVKSADEELADGTALFARGDMIGAEQSFRRAVGRDPRRADAMLNIGTALKRQRRNAEALEYLEKAVALKPDWSSAHANLASGLCDLGRLDEAETACREAIRLDPKSRNAYSNLASVYAARRKDSEAVGFFRKALEIGPPTAEIYVNLTASCISSGQLEEAVAASRSAIALQPDLAEAHANLAVALGAQGKPKECIQASRDVVKLKPELQLAWSNLLFSLNYADGLSPEEVFREHRDWGQRMAALATLHHANTVDPARPLKVGFISADFCAHSVAFFLKPLFDAHDGKVFAFHCYSDVFNPDLYTDFLKARAAGWHSIVGLPDSRVAELVQGDGIDILIDLAGHTSKNRLGVFMRKPAPVQVSWLGYPNTTGLPAMDWRLVDAVTDPVGTADALAVERLHRLAAPFMCYDAAPKTPDVGPLPALTNGAVTFGSFNKINKISDSAVRLWARVLAAVPNSRLILKSLSFNDPATRERLLAIVTSAGVAAERATLLSWEPLLKGHLETYHRIDIALDTLPYNGTTTTCEAAWMGVPTVALCGDSHAARVGATINQAIGLPQLVAADEAGFVKAAAVLAADLSALAALRTGLRDRMRGSPLCDATGFARKFESALRQIWQDWCGAAQAAPSPTAKIKEDAVLRLQIAGDVEITVPDDLTLISPYILLEQEDWFEDEAPFVRSMLRTGDQVVDIGANYGVYSLTAARAVGPTGRVWSFEPAHRTADFLARSIAQNGFSQVQLIRAGLSNRSGTASLSVGAHSELNSLHGTAGGAGEQIALTTLDLWAAENGWPKIDFIKLDAEGEEPNVIRGGAEFLQRASPLIMFEVKHGTTLNLALVDQFAAIGYRAYRLVPGLGLLRPFDPKGGNDAFLLNLFCCKPDRAAALAARGLLCEATADFDSQALSPDAWRSAMQNLPYAEAQIAGWASSMQREPEYARALAAYFHALYGQKSASERLAAMEFSYQTLKRLFDARGDVGRALSLGRAAEDLGLRGFALAVLKGLSERGSERTANDGLAYLAPSARYERVAPKGDLAGWRKAAILETVIQLQSYSGVFGASASAQLEQLCSTGFQSAEAERRRILALRRDGKLPSGTIPRALQERSAENRNPDYWAGQFQSEPKDEAASPLLDLLPDVGPVNVVDVGAMMLKEEGEPYRPLLNAGKARVVGFEPNEAECAKLNAKARSGTARYYPYFIGDGSERTYYETNAAMTGSLYPPNPEVAKKFHYLNELMTLRAEHPGIKTRRLDDLTDLEGLDDIDLIKIDVQGAELDVFRGAPKALESALVIITEVEFVPIYVGQPLFGDVDLHLREHGFLFHTFNGFGQRFFRPFSAPTDPEAAFRQVLWCDAVYVKDFMRFDRLSDEKLLKLALILDMTLGSLDLAAVALTEYDRRHQTSYAPSYMAKTVERQAAAKRAQA